MREILFRGKENPSGKWVQGFLVGRCHIGDWVNCTPIHSKTVGQFTGLTDKSGKKVFEHDMIRHHFGDEIGVIRFGQYRNPFGDDEFGGHIGFYVEWIAGTYPQTLREDLGYWMQMVEVIGNIHDHPELLEGGAEGCG